MKITTKITIAIESGEILEHEWHEYDGPLALCCGGPSKEEKEAAAEQKKLTEQQAQFTSQLQQQQGELFKEDQAIRDFLLPKLQDIMQNPVGFSPAELADLTAQNINTAGAQYAAAQKAVNQQLATRNMAGLPSGVAAQIDAQVASAAAGQVATEQGRINLASSELAQQKQQAAQSEILGLESGTGNLAIGTAGQSNSGMGVASGSNQAYFDQTYKMATQGSQFWSGLLGGIIGTGMDALTGGVVGGVGGMMSGSGFGKGFGQGVNSALG